MNDFFKKNIKALLVMMLAFIIFLGILSIFRTRGLFTPINQPKVGTPMMAIDDSVKERELYSQNDLNLSSVMSKSLLNDDAMSYGDFLKAYGDKRIQFDDGCHATPNNASFNVGDFLILDNRSDKIQAIRFVDDLYALPPLHVRVFELKRQGIFDIDCGSSRNVARIIVH